MENSLNLKLQLVCAQKVETRVEKFVSIERLRMPLLEELTMPANIDKRPKYGKEKEV